MTNPVAARLAQMRDRLDRYGVIESGDLPDLLGAVEDVLALHGRVTHGHGTGWVGEPFTECCHCHLSWPCPTVAAITARLGEA